MLRSMRERSAQRELHPRSDTRWAIGSAVSAADRDELIEITVRNDIRI